MDPLELKKRIRTAFETEALPVAEDITPHRCAECDEIADDLAGRRPAEISKERLAYHCWDLPFLSSDAKRYYLTAWLFASIDEPDADFTDAVLMNLEGDHRNDGYSKAQKTAILDYLRYVRVRDHELDTSDIDRAEEQWT
jgi:hypothetical protein